MRTLFLSLVFSTVVSSQYTLTQNHQGASFFDSWNFYEGLDVNNTGNIFYVSENTARDQKLVFVNDVGNTVIKVDNFTDGSGNSSYLRNTVKILSVYTVYTGDLVMMDAVHMPFGCSLWPAFWTQGPVWPDNGEIDIIENINLATNNRFSLHTLNGCRHPASTTSFAADGTAIMSETGILISTDCFNRTNFDEGCLVEDPNPASYGAGFAAAGGGAYAMLWDDSGIKLWFFERKDVPGDFSSDNPNPDSWGLPKAFYPTTACNFTQFFTPQSLIFETTICGNFALPQFSQTCKGDCLALVPIPSNYNDAYWEISFVKVFHQTASLPASDVISPTTTNSVSPLETTDEILNQPSGTNPPSQHTNAVSRSTTISIGSVFYTSMFSLIMLLALCLL